MHFIEFGFDAFLCGMNANSEDIERGSETGEEVVLGLDTEGIQSEDVDGPRAGI